MATTTIEPIDPPGSVATAPSLMSEPSVRRRVAERLVRPMPADEVAGWLAPMAVFLVSLLMRLHRLAVPKADAFDEVYYACDAQSLLRHGIEVAHKARDQGFCIEDTAATEPGFVVHPPLGKWMIALGEKMWGFDSFGWRFSAAIFGALSVLLLCRIARRMFRSTLLGCIAGGILAFDGLHFVQSRMAMLDIFLLFFTVAAFGCIVVDRDVMRARLAATLDGNLSTPGPKLGLRWWRVAAGACLGAAVATKWTGLYFVIVFGLLTFAWDVGARRTAGIPWPFLSTIRREALSLVSCVLLVGSLVYVASWAGWFAGDEGWRRAPGTFGSNLAHQTHHGPVKGFAEYHREIWNFHQGLQTDHSYESKPESWFLLVRPVAYYYVTPEEGQSQATLGVGTPAIWWAAIPAFVALAWAWVSKRDWRAAAILVTIGGTYLPWFLESDRTMFLFYALPLVPFMALALAYCAGMAIGRPEDSVRRRRIGAGFVGAYLALVVANFLYLYPILSSQVIPYSEWSERMLFKTWI
ncbi:MAG TPA: phospholipid carrier-dependent glycosyltransferase [Mycobacteriales bacterium]|nr:phospholipid carrier-dependent glycosyltransferase [Mycobacteriales bacterium]